MKTFFALMAAAFSVASAFEVLVCEHLDLSGQCAWINGPDQCTNFPAFMNDKASSLDTLGKNCQFYVDGGCRGNFWYVNGRQNSIPKDFNDKFSSVMCI